mgnify:CR=1 FL=1
MLSKGLPKIHTGRSGGVAYNGDAIMKLQRIILSLGVLCLSSMVIAGEAPSAIDQAFRMQAEAVKAMDVTCHIKTVDRSARVSDRAVTLKWDMSNDRVYGTAAMDVGRDEPSCSAFVRNAKYEWCADAIQTSKKRGTFNVHIFESGKGNTEQILRYQYGMVYLERMLIPAHVLIERQNPELRDAGVLANARIETKTDASSGLSTVTYDMSYGEDVGRYVYDVDMRDGLKLLACTEFIIVNGEPRINTKQEFSGHTKANGVWIPHKMVETWWDESGAQEQLLEVEIDAIQINPVFVEDDFVYKPPYGSIVVDHIAGIKYTVGSLELPLKGSDNLSSEDILTPPEPRAETKPDAVPDADIVKTEDDSAKVAVEGSGTKAHNKVAAIIGAAVALSILLFVAIRRARKT